MTGICMVILMQDPMESKLILSNDIIPKRKESCVASVRYILANIYGMSVVTTKMSRHYGNTGSANALRNQV